ncbi:uncharacterized protein LOC142231806 [Haematobia irritans]|uniref:uncharacterized protein LOC142231806 n=1 Tax=Haematobia irritans TaxID=7368 RepID=UPI003F4F8ED3
MPSIIFCWFCIGKCTKYKSICDERIYNIAAQYFEATFLSVSEEVNEKFICFECWRNILAFHKFRRSVLEAHSSLQDNDELMEASKYEEDEYDSETKSSDRDENQSEWFDDDNEDDGDPLEVSCDIEIKEETDIKSEQDDDFELYNNFTLEINEGKATELDEKRKTQLNPPSQRTAIYPTECLNEDNNSSLPTVDLDSRTKNTISRKEELDNIIAKWKPILNCVSCNEPFNTFTLLQEHFRQSHQNEEFFVKCCNVKIKKRCHFAEHSNIHVEAVTFKCTMCSRSFARERNLRHHIKTIHEIKGRSESATRVRSTNRQGRVLARDKSDDFISKWISQLKCGICQKSFPKYTLLHHHFKEEHTNETCFVACCGKRFYKRRYLQEHITMHENPQAFQCDICGKRLSSNYYLKAHLKKFHQNDQDKNMPENIEIDESSHLISSQTKKKRQTANELDRIIAEFKPNLECVRCSENYPNLTLLRQHFSKKHPNNVFYITCCQIKFSERTSFVDHIKFHKDPNVFKCEICSISFASSRNLIRHWDRKHN